MAIALTAEAILSIVVEVCDLTNDEYEDWQDDSDLYMAAGAMADRMEALALRSAS